MQSFEYESRFPWLEITLIISAVLLVFQLFPDLWTTLLVALDFRQWEWTVWTGVNVLVLAALIFIRAWRDR